MNPPPLPPPPGAQEWRGPLPPTISSVPRDPIADRPSWRQGRAGWALLHLAIGIGLAVAGLFLIGIVVAISGRTEAQLDRADDGLTALAFFVLIAACVIGWMCFAYLRGAPGRRWIALIAAAGGGWLISMALMFQATR